MDPTERVNQLFAESVQLSIAAAETQSRSIVRAAQAVVACLLGGGKVLSCGNGSSAADAQYFAAQMQHRFDRERPGLPAIALTADAAILTAIAVEEGFEAIYAKRVSALGHPGDLLLTLSINGMASNVIAAIHAAQEHQMQIVALTGRDGGQVAEMLRESDIEIRAPTYEAARVLENHRLVMHCLCDLIDLQLLGG